MEAEKISILMPVYNAGPFLEACLDSVLAQSLDIWELIAVDDSSTDNSLSILQEYSSKDQRINVLRQEKSGIVSALKLAYAQCDGAYITRMDADDLMPERKLELLKLNCGPGKLATGFVSYFSNDWDLGRGFKSYRDWINGIMESGEWESQLYRECVIPSPAWMLVREDFENIGGFDSALLPEDYDLCFRMFNSGLKLNPVLEVVHHWRDHEHRTSRTDSVYFPLAYMDVKIHYFLKLHYNPDRELIIWGAGKKGKRAAKQLNIAGVSFRWITDNPRKIGVQISGQILEDQQLAIEGGPQYIVAISSPEDRVAVAKMLELKGLKEIVDYFWFC